MAKSKAPKPAKPDAEAVNQIASDVEARLLADQTADTALPDGVQAGLFDGGGKGIAKLLPELVTPLLKIAGMGSDGQITPAEAKEIVEDVFGLVTRLLARRRESRSAPAAE